MSPESATASSSSAASPPDGVRPIPFGQIRSPGAYVCDWSGRLLRIPERASVPADALAARLSGGRVHPLTVTKISDDPGVTLSEARRLAGSLGLAVGF